jgi:hypothetical protein
MDGADNFSVRIAEEDSLEVTSGKERYLIERDDLQALWVALSHGLITREQAKWSAAEAADQLLSVISVMPGVRPVEIQKRNSPHPEIALELEKPRVAAKVSLVDVEQHQFEWA